jgi:hypothetical protein
MKTDSALPNPAALAVPLLALTLLYWKWRHVIAMIWQIRRSLLNALIHGGLVSGVLTAVAVLLVVFIGGRSSRPPTTSGRAVRPELASGAA